ncbi:MAG: molybdate ABC transporter substrate-binding protein [Pseudomonadales bacterium]|nr:molybdate ABC transporter substrate-binding protein [Pseudomonadales bacterium]
MPVKPCLVLTFLLILASNGACAADVQVAVAANFSEPMRRIAVLFEEATGHHARLSFGASGMFYAQIKAGAPFDLLLSADQKIPAALLDEGLALPGTRRTYARGRLVLWSADPQLVGAGPEVLSRPGWRHLALANPQLAPYGAAAAQTLDKLGLREALTPRLVQGENISQTYQFIATGNAELGFIAWSQVIGKDGQIASGSAWLVPANLHQPILQDLVLLNPARDNPAADALLQFLQTPVVTALIRDSGYEI